MPKQPLKYIIPIVLLIAAILQYPLLQSDAEGLLGFFVASTYAFIGFTVWALFAFVLLLRMIQHRSFCPPSVTRLQMISAVASPIIGLGSYLFLTEECDIHDLEHNYQAHQVEIHAVKHFVDQITPPGFWVYLKFHKNGNMDMRVGVVPPDKKSIGTLLFEEWDFDCRKFTERPLTSRWSNKWDPKIYSLDSVLSILHWNASTFDQIRRHLKDAGCASVKTVDPTEIGYRLRGMGEYYYLIPDTPFSGESRQRWNDSLHYVLYSDSLAFGYKGGGFGPQTFPDFPRRIRY
jgi:hypothetical protein